jgi:CRP-like cAMP-binding protein
MSKMDSIAISQFKNHINNKVVLEENEFQELTSFFRMVKVKKRQFIIQPNFIAPHRNYVLQGAFRAYVVGEEGEEHTIQLAIEDWWISDYNSYIYQKPATMFVVALEDSVLLQIEHEKEQQLKSLNHKYETFFRITAERSTAFMQRRIITNLTKTAEERFNEFEERYPNLSRRIPQYVIASYLGMTTEYLSKLRNKRLHNH